MTTITIDNDLNLSKTHFKNIEEFQMELLLRNEQLELSEAHKKILDERLAESEQHPANFVTLEELKYSIKRV